MSVHVADISKGGEKVRKEGEKLTGSERKKVLGTEKCPCPNGCHYATPDSSIKTQGVKSTIIYPVDKCSIGNMAPAS